MQQSAWLKEFMPPAIRHLDNSAYEVLNCDNTWDANPESVVGHTAMRAGVRHLCLRVSTTEGRSLTVAEVEAPHWRDTPSIFGSGATCGSTERAPLRSEKSGPHEK